MKCIKNGSLVIVVLDDGSIIQNSNCTETMFDALTQASSVEEIREILNPEIKELIKEVKRTEKTVDYIKKSSILAIHNDSIYWEEVSNLSMPLNLACKIVEAEENKDVDAVEGYKNFWTLLSLNPDSECRQNLWWFLDSFGFVISKSGLFVGYRNVDIKKDDSYNTVYTDAHTHTFDIRIGEMVRMPRSKCDCNSKNECSKGLICSPLGK